MRKIDLMRSNRLLLTFILVLFAQFATAHGSVVADDDLCIINIEYFQAHFKIYQPLEYRHRDYCEDLPSSGETIFVMEYIHGELGESPMDFRIIRNTTGLGTFTKMSDVEALDNIEDVTVFYQQPEKNADIFTVMYNFQDRGEYLGIVTATNTETGRVYSAVFPFEVGYTRFGLLPLFLVLLVLIQGAWWFWSKKQKRLVMENE
jgi:hypothetical protein